MSHAPENSDSEFTWENFQVSVNKDLADVLGNFVSRVTKFCRTRFGESVPSGGTYGPQEEAVREALATRLRAYEENMEAIEIRKAAGELRAIWVIGNEYLQSAAPWALFKTDPDQAGAIIRFSLNLIRLYAVLSEPFIPETSARLREALNAAKAGWPDDLATALEALKGGEAFTVPDNLFAKISDQERDEWQEKFAGARA